MLTNKHGRLLILDRDGVINVDSDAYIKTVDEWQPIPGSIEAIVRLSHAGYRIAIASNQSGLARGLFTPSELNAIHQRLRGLVASQGGRIELIAFCPHAPAANCRCRKPRTGLLEEIAERLDSDLDAVVFVGDSISDIEAAYAAGALPYLVRTGKGERTLASIHAGDPESALFDVAVFENLAAVADALLMHQELI